MVKNIFWLRNIVSNLVIVVVIVAIAFVGFSDISATLAFNPEYNAIYRGNTENKNATLMINVYWGTEYIEPMLQILKDNNVKTTFFVGGTWVSSNCELLQKIIDDGHEIGNHGYYHKDQKYLSNEKNIEEISNTHDLVKNLCNYEMNLFAPPSGSFSQTTLTVAKSLGYQTIMWSKDTIDWRDKDEDLIFSRATNNLKNGELVLMHPTICTVRAFDKIIKYYLSNGFNIVPVSQNIA